MKLANAEIGMTLELQENNAVVVSIECPELFTRVIGELKSQMECGEGNFILSEGNEEIRLDKAVEFVIDPFSIDINSKRLYSKFLQDMKMVSTNYLYENYLKLKADIFQYIELLSEKMPFNVCYETEIEETALYKILNVKIESEYETLAQNIANYAKLSQQLLGTKVMILVNIKDYVSEQELIELYKDLFYSKVYVLVLEARKNVTLLGECGIIIDKDKCFIEY